MKVFIDTEFIETGESIHLISIGMVREDQKELYLQMEAPFNKASEWVWRNVIPSLYHFSFALQRRSCEPLIIGMNDGNGSCSSSGCPWRSRFAARREIVEFCGDKPEFWGYYADYDWVALCQLFGTMMELPKGWPMYCRDIKQLSDQYGNFELPQQGKDEHNALIDARWNRRAWQELSNIVSVKPGDLP